MCVSTFSLFIPFLPVFFVLYVKNLVLLNVINRYVTPAIEYFLKSKGIVELGKSLMSANFSFNVVQTAAVKP